MRVGKHSGSTAIPIDPSQCFMLRTLTVYVDRLLAKHGTVEHETLDMLYWLVGPEIVREDLIPLAAMLNGEGRKRRFEPDMTEEIRHSRDFSHFMDNALRKLKRNEQSAVADLFRGLLKKRQDMLKYKGISDIERNLDAFQRIFGLSDVETDLSLFFLIISVYEEAESLFGYHLKCDRYAGRTYLAACLNGTPQEISNALEGKLSRIGILESGHRSVGLESDFLRFLQNATAADIETEFFKKIAPAPLPLDAHNVEPEAIEHALRLLSPENDKEGCGLLLYGNPGVGKTTFAYGLGKELGLDIYLCKHEGKHKPWQRQAAVMASVHMAGQNRNSLLIVDDCDSILGTRHLWGFFGTYNDKKWLHEVLESDAKIIFIVNDVRLLEESVIRRFSFSIHFKPFSRGQRIRLWKNMLDAHGHRLALTDAQISSLATSYDTSPGVIEQAVSRAAQTASPSGKGFYEAITLSLDAHEGLCRGGHKVIRRKPVDKDFTLEGLNVIGTDLQVLMKDLEACDQHLKKSSESDLIGCSLLFHGPSGTGKSHLARHIASVLDREVVSKRGSDLLSSYVGETEQRIRSAYEEAESKEAILLIDEADSLIFNRDKAHRSWELSFTNEFLNCMEDFQGIQIFTTNRLSDLDSASLRRFDHKLEFSHLKPEGIVILYEKILQPLVGVGLDKALADDVKGIEGLTAGDFKVVKSKYRFKSEVSHAALIAALREESRAKEIHVGKKVIGF